MHHSPGYSPTFYWASPLDDSINVTAQCQRSPPECAIEPQKEPKYPGS